MIKRAINYIKDLLRAPERSFKEKVFILLTLLTDLVGIIAIIGDIITEENIVEIIALVIIVIAVPIGTIVSIRRDKIALAEKIIVVGIVVVLLPILFIFGGGFQGGGVIWMIFAFLYTGLVLSGIWKMTIMVLLTLEALGFYAMSIFTPQYVFTHSEGRYNLDILFSLILVGLICSITVWFVEWLFREENKRAGEEMKKYEELNRAQNKFFSSMSHEIRTPINSILGLNEIILRQEDASEEIKNDASNIQGAGKMLLSLINDILDMSKIEAGKMDIIPVNYNLADMISEIVNMIWLRAQQKGLEFKIEIDPSIPAELFGDEVRIKQILVNLLNNSVKYTKEGSVTLRIEKDEMRGDDVLLLISVIDTGMGIKQDVIPYLFDAFQRADEEKNAKIEGTGLGLSIVKQLVELMDGRITVNSVYTEGSTFTVTLWQRVTRHEAIGVVNIKNLGKNEDGGRYVPGFKAPEARILIVDDNEMNLEVEKKLLEETEMNIDTVMSGEEALVKAASEHYDMILMDHLMPEMDGIECMQAIRRQVGGLNNHAPVIVLTANADSENKELYSRSGFDGFLVKPVSGNQLEDMILSHLPDMKIVKTEAGVSRVQLNSARGYSRKLPILIATSTMADLAPSVLRAHQIERIPFSVISGGHRYSDYLEASTDEVMRYVREGGDYDSEPPSASDFEKFFGNGVKKAHQIIYIAVSDQISREYVNAKEAARAFGNVYVIDSYCNSTSLGMLVLLAQRMADQGRSYEKIIDEVERIKKYVHCSFITGDADLVLRRGAIARAVSSFISTFGFRPVIHIREGKITPARLFAGDMLMCYKKYIDYALPKNIDPDLDLLVVDYVRLSEDDKDDIYEYIRSKYRFDHIIFQKVSSVMSLNCGKDAMGLAYIKKCEQPYNLSQMLAPMLEFTEGPADQAVNDDPRAFLNEIEEEIKAEETEPKWYENIPGLDAAKALENSGSEESLLSVLDIFYKSINQRSKEIEGYYKDEDWENYTVKVHALKSSAKLVGAMKLSDDALKLEMAGKRRDTDFIREHTYKLLEDFRSYKDILSPYLSPSDDDNTSEKEKSEYVRDPFIASIYEALRDAAANKDDMLIEEILGEAAEFTIPLEEVDRLYKIKESFKEKNYDAIKKLSEE